YRLMLRGLPELDELDASVILREPGDPSAADTSLGGAAVKVRVVEVKRQKYTPERDLEVRSDRAPAVLGLRHDNLVVARVSPAGEMPPAPIGALTVLFDTSASRALGFDRQIHRLADVLKSMREQSGEDFALRVLCFDQATEVVYAGPVSGFGQAQLERIASRRALGASDLAGALAAVAKDAGGSRRMLVFSDGIATAGSAEHAALRDAAKALTAVGFERVDAIIDGGIQDAGALKALTTADLPRDGVVMDARLPLETIAHKLGSATLPAMKVSVPGAKWVWPETIEGAQPGDELLVYADLSGDVAMRVVIEGEDRIEVAVPTTPVERPLLERAWVRAQIERLQAQRSRLPETDAQARDGLKTTIVQLSTKYRVLSDFTAMLVLETERDYERFGIDRNALADILTVGSTGVELLHRKDTPLPQPVPADPQAEYRLAVPQRARGADPAVTARQEGVLGVMSQESGHFAVGDDADVWGGITGNAIGEAYGVGGLGLVGTGQGGGGTGEGTIGLGDTGLIGRGGGSGSGYGRGAGAGFGGRGARIPTVRMARPEVQGALDQDIIRRIVRAHINEIRYCYEQALRRDPRAKGRVQLRFVIGNDGKVQSAAVGENTLRDAAVAACMAGAVRRWLFPRPERGSVTVTYPFTLEPDGPVSAVARAEPLMPAGPPPPPTPEEEARIRAAQEALETRLRELEEQERIRAAERAAEEAEARRTEGSPYSGKFFDVHQRLKEGDARGAMGLALEWHAQDPGDVLALVALGEAGIELAVDTFAKAVASRPDHPSSHRLYAYALLKAGRHQEAFEAIKAGVTRQYPLGRFRGVDRILREDMGLIAAAWIKADPSVAHTVRATLDGLNIALPRGPSTRFVINWETDANDVDFHVRDGREGHAYYGQRRLASGGELYDDVTTGYGPECFTIEGTPKAFPYKFEAHYFSRGPMGYGMGKLQIVQHDGKGELRFDERPFLIMKDRAYLDLGELQKPL
ncbi:MAG TPA: AgmX/PglI C-terminal domain-containing protein, partial [Nannocystis sp.]